MTDDRDRLTAAELIEELRKLPPETLVTIQDWDSEWGHTAVWSVSEVAEDGELYRGDILRSWSSDEDD